VWSHVSCKWHASLTYIIGAGDIRLKKKESAQKPSVVVRKVQKPTACPGRCEKNRSLTWVPLRKHESDRHATTGQLKTGGSAPPYHLQCRWEVEVESAKKLSDSWCGLWLDPHRVCATRTLAPIPRNMMSATYISR
jgi:hypothetical protein